MSFAGGITFGVLLVLLCIFAYIVVSVLMGIFGGQRAAQKAQSVTYPLAQEEPMAVGPGVQPNPPADLAALRLEEDTVLDNYAWVDKAHGIVRIPIAQAMQLVVQQGLPSRPNPPAEEGPEYPEASSSGRMMERFVP
jgi:hypothetical protein